jgi:hypothetical protein
VTKLSADELTTFSQWFEEFVADQWDRQIEQDAKAGGLNEALNRTIKHRDEGRVTPLCEPLH